MTDDSPRAARIQPNRKAGRVNEDSQALPGGLRWIVGQEVVRFFLHEADFPAVLVNEGPWNVQRPGQAALLEALEDIHRNLGSSFENLVIAVDGDRLEGKECRSGLIKDQKQGHSGVRVRNGMGKQDGLKSVDREHIVSRDLGDRAQGDERAGQQRRQGVGTNLVPLHGARQELDGNEVGIRRVEIKVRSGFSLLKVEQVDFVQR